MDSRVQVVKGYRPFGGSIHRFLNGLHEKSYSQSTVAIFRGFAKELNTAVAVWEHNSLPLRDMLKLPDEDFQANQEDLIRWLGVDLRGHQKVLEESGPDLFDSNDLEI